MNNLIELLGLTAGCCTTFSFLPQVLKVYRTRSVKDISLGMYIAFCFGVLLWIVYGAILPSFAIFTANIVCFLLASAVLFMKIIWRT